MKYDIAEIENEGFKEGFWTGTKKLFIFIVLTIVIAIGAIILVIYLSNQTTELKGSMRIENLMEHLHKLQDIATQHGGTRTTGVGLNASADYIIEKLMETGAYEIETQVFDIRSYRQLETPELHFLDPFQATYVFGRDFQVFPFSGNGNITGNLFHVENRGCDPEDWQNFPADHIALVRRGNCNFSQKINRGATFNASGMIIYNSGENGDTGIYTGNIGSDSLVQFPVFSTTYNLGVSFSTFPDAVLNMYAQGTVNVEYTRNIVADSKNGNPGRVIVIGSHLDSVPAGPGINDNGSGSSANLELAIQSAKYLKNSKQKLRFIWFGAEELGLLGSHHYIDDLQEHHPDELRKIVLNLNFDMLASPNFHRGIYNGTAAPSNIVKASTEIQKLFQTFFEIKNITSVLVPFNGRSDYGPFIDVGIPAGGLFTGAEQIKDDESRKLFGGLANTAFDPCYHKACDTVDNINQEVFLQNAEAAAYVVQILASSKDIEKLLNGGEAERLSSQLREWREIKDRKHLYFNMK